MGWKTQVLSKIVAYGDTINEPHFTLGVMANVPPRSNNFIGANV
jgi:hypothetical protein